MPDALDELYAGPLDTFVARRKVLAAERKAAGDGEAAAALKGAVKPTLSAWVVNQVAHHRPEVVRAALDATADVMRAQLDASGGDDDRRRYERALARQRDAEERLSDAVQEVAGDASADLMRRVQENFRRGALDAETRQVLRAGHLTRDVEPTDFGVLLQQLGAKPAQVRPEPRDREEARKATEERRRAEDAERRRKQAAARQGLDRAEKEVERLRVDLAAAERELTKARAAVEGD
jgi:hypothetical protein